LRTNRRQQSRNFCGRSGSTRFSRFDTKEAAEDYLLKLKTEYNVYNEEISELRLEEN